MLLGKTRTDTISPIRPWKVKKLSRSPYQGTRQKPTSPTATHRARVGWRNGSGLVTPAFVHRLARRVRVRRRVPVLIDSRYALTRYSRLTACTPNESEVEHALGVTIDDRPRVLERAGRTILERTRMEAVLITRGSRGMALFEPNKPTIHIPIFGSDQIADVTGAGDTVMATIPLALGAGATFEEAARLANYAGGLVVMKRGTATVTADELRHAVELDARRAT